MVLPAKWTKSVTYVEKDIKIIEDSAQASGTITPMGPAANPYSLSTFSFYPTKNLQQ